MSVGEQHIGRDWRERSTDERRQIRASTSLAREFCSEGPASACQCHLVRSIFSARCECEAKKLLKDFSLHFDILGLLFVGLHSRSSLFLDHAHSFKWLWLRRCVATRLAFKDSFIRLCFGRSARMPWLFSKRPSRLIWQKVRNCFGVKEMKSWDQRM